MAYVITERALRLSAKIAKVFLPYKTSEMASSKTPAEKVRIDSIHGAGMARFCEISCKTVPEIPQLPDAKAASRIPRLTRR